MKPDSLIAKVGVIWIIGFAVVTWAEDVPPRPPASEEVPAPPSTTPEVPAVATEDFERFSAGASGRFKTEATTWVFSKVGLDIVDGKGRGGGHAAVLNAGQDSGSLVQASIACIVPALERQEVGFWVKKVSEDPRFALAVVVSEGKSRKLIGRLTLAERTMPVASTPVVAIAPDAEGWTKVRIVLDHAKREMTAMVGENKVAFGVTGENSSPLPAGGYFIQFYVNYKTSKNKDPVLVDDVTFLTK